MTVFPLSVSAKKKEKTPDSGVIGTAVINTHTPGPDPSHWHDDHRRRSARRRLGFARTPQPEAGGHGKPVDADVSAWSRLSVAAVHMAVSPGFCSPTRRFNARHVTSESQNTKNALTKI